MSRIHRRDTTPELAVRRLLHARGVRFRVDFKVSGVGRVDIAFTRRKFAVFIDGCFWHGCPEHAVKPKTNTTFWLPKLQRNQERDQQQMAALHTLGWTALRIWEHEVKNDLPLVVDKILTILKAPKEFEQ